MKTIVIYAKDGSELEEDSKESVAKSLVNDETKKKLFYVKFFRGTPLNVTDAAYFRNRVNAKYRLVNEKAFNYYMKYITGKGESFLRETERALS